jgi:uncharacterized protein
MAHSYYPAASLPENILGFCEVLRLEYDFKLGPAEVRDALRAFEVLGVSSLSRARDGLRLVLCAKFEDVSVFDRAFTNFFFPKPLGVPQENQPPLEPEKPKRPNNQKAEEAKNKLDEKVKDNSSDNEQDNEDFEGESKRQTPEEDDDNAEQTDMVMRAKYSLASAQTSAPEIRRDGLEAMLRAASELVNRLKLGRSRKWRNLPKGARFDFRRTMRSSLSTGGDALHPRWLGHPHRNPRIVVLLDGSRSMLESSHAVLQFAFALAQRSRRVDVFTFSTDLKDVTRDLRGLVQERQKLELGNMAKAWGGGTRIGESLRVFVREHASRVLTPDTIVLISSDGLDVGEVDVLENAMKEIKRRSAGVIWLNPLASHPEFKPTARGMQAALPYISLLCHASSPVEFSSLAQGLRLSR